MFIRGQIVSGHEEPEPHDPIPLYAPPVPKQLVQRSPTKALLLGLVITLAAVVACSWYISRQIAGLQELQRDLADRNRKDSLQLLRIQNDLNSAALAMRDMVDSDEPYPLTAWSSQFQRIRADLDVAVRLEEQFATARRTPEQRAYLASSLQQFWDAVDRTFVLARDGRESEARAQIRLSLQARQAALSTAVARLLVENNEAEQQTAQRVEQVYGRVQRQVYVFLTATLITILLTSAYLIVSNRRIFARLASLSEQRSELAQRLISMQESTLRHVSRELHDEFGQILTAMGVMLARAGNQAPENSQLRSDIREVRETAQAALQKVRGLSQALHPVTLEEAGLESTLDWYIPTVERQTGMVIAYEKSGAPFPVRPGAGVHVYRVLQEALNNVTRHSGADHAWVRLRFGPRQMELEIEDHGKGVTHNGTRPGIGVVAMRERAELLGGQFEIVHPESGGTLVRLVVPRSAVDSDED